MTRSAIIFVVSLPISCLSLFGQQSPATAYWRSCDAEEMKVPPTSAMRSPDIDSETESFEGDCMELYLTVLCTMPSYAAADCHFRQDAHRRMALVIARILRAEEREGGERAQDHQSVHGETFFYVINFC
jgi:hypothetical protein